MKNSHKFFVLSAIFAVVLVVGSQTASAACTPITNGVKIGTTSYTNYCYCSSTNRSSCSVMTFTCNYDGSLASQPYLCPSGCNVSKTACAAAPTPTKTPIITPTPTKTPTATPTPSSTPIPALCTNDASCSSGSKCVLGRCHKSCVAGSQTNGCAIGETCWQNQSSTSASFYCFKPCSLTDWVANSSPRTLSGDSNQCQLCSNLPVSDQSGVVSYLNGGTDAFQPNNGQCLAPTAAPLAITCSASRSTATVGQEVVFTPNIPAGSGIYTYKWSGDEITCSNGTTQDTKSCNVTFSRAGTKNATIAVTLTSGGNIQIATAACTPVIVSAVSVAPFSISCTGSPNPANLNQPVQFMTQNIIPETGGRVTYLWSGDVIGNTYYTTKQFSAAGTKQATVTVTVTNPGKPNQTASACCEVQVNCSATVQTILNSALNISGAAKPLLSPIVNGSQNRSSCSSNVSNTGSASYTCNGPSDALLKTNLESGRDEQRSITVMIPVSSQESRAIRYVDACVDSNGNLLDPNSNQATDTVEHYSCAEITATAGQQIASGAQRGINFLQQNNSRLAGCPVANGLRAGATALANRNINLKPAWRQFRCSDYGQGYKCYKGACQVPPQGVVVAPSPTLNNSALTFLPTSLWSLIMDFFANFWNGLKALFGR